MKPPTHPASVYVKSPATWVSRRGTVLARAKREGWTRQIESSKALVKREAAPLAITPVEAVAMSIQQRGERHIERMADVSERGVDHIETMDGLEILNFVDQIEKLDKVARRTFRLDDNPLPAGCTLNMLNINSLQVDENGSVKPIEGSTQ